MTNQRQPRLDWQYNPYSPHSSHQQIQRAMNEQIERMRKRMGYSTDIEDDEDIDEDEYDHEEIATALEMLTWSDAAWLDRICIANNLSENFKNELILGAYDIDVDDDDKNCTPEWRAWVRGEIAANARRTGCTPTLDPDTIESDWPRTNDEGQDNMELSMTVNREKLVAALTEKRDEVKGELQAKVDEVKQKLDDAKSGNSTVTYLEKLTQLVKDGKINVYDYHGRQQKGRATESLLAVQATDRHALEIEGGLPEAPSQERENSLSRLTSNVERAEMQLKNSTAPYDAALQLLEMSSDENVGIPASEYQRLLAGKPAAPSTDEF